MYTPPDRDQQIRQTHAPLIHQVVKSCQNIEGRKELEPMLNMALEQGWGDLVSRIRLVLDGGREESLTLGLDEEDTIIMQAVLQGIQNPASLPPLNQGADPTVAAPGLAHMIHAANHGDAGALQSLASMAEQMVNLPGDMRRLGGIINRLLGGERDPDVLCKGMDISGEKLILNLLDELNKLGEQ